jgi:hypothetical protein
MDYLVARGTRVRVLGHNNGGMLTRLRDRLVAEGEARLRAEAGPVHFTGDRDADLLLNDLAHHPHAFVFARPRLSPSTPSRPRPMGSRPPGVGHATTTHDRLHRRPATLSARYRGEFASIQNGPVTPCLGGQARLG